MRLALVGVPGIAHEPAWARRDSRRTTRSAASTASSLLLADSAPTGAILTDVLGFTEVGARATITRYRRAGRRLTAAIVDLRAAGGFLPARQGARLGPSHRVPRGR